MVYFISNSRTHLQLLDDSLELRFINGKGTALGPIVIVESQPGLVYWINVIGTCILRQSNNIRQTMQIRRVVFVFGDAQETIFWTVQEMHFIY